MVVIPFEVAGEAPCNVSAVAGKVEDARVEDPDVETPGLDSAQLELVVVMQGDVAECAFALLSVIDEDVLIRVLLRKTGDGGLRELLLGASEILKNAVDDSAHPVVDCEAGYRERRIVSSMANTPTRWESTTYRRRCPKDRLARTKHETRRRQGRGSMTCTW